MTSDIVKTCPKCRSAIPWKDVAGGVGADWYCSGCYPEVQAVRLERMRRELAGVDRFTKKCEELRRLDKEIKQMNSRRDELLQSVRTEERIKAVETIRRMSFWQRLRLCFSPFNTEVPQ